MKNSYYNRKVLEFFLKKFVPFLPAWSGLLCNPEHRYCNSFVENYFAQTKKKVRSKILKIGKLPTKCLRVLKAMRGEVQYIYDQLLYKVPKKRLSTAKKRKLSVPTVRTGLELSNVSSFNATEMGKERK